MTITIETTPVDESGRLVHAEDATAQLCLAFARLESALAARGLGASSITRLRVRTCAPTDASDLADLVEEWLDGTPVPVELVDVAHLALPGMLVELRAQVPFTHSDSDSKDPIMNPTTTHLTALRALGTVLFPGDPGYDETCLPWNLAVRQQPAAVAVPRSADDVVELVRAATATGLRIAPQSTGHAAAALADVGFHDVLLVRLHEFTGVTVDPAARVARVTGGTLWRDVIAATAPHGLTALHGSAGDVAVAGYLLGGGLSFYGREHGLAASAVRAIELVTADGSLVRATADQHPDLFWALRGGGGNFGIVVAIEIELLELAEVFAGMLLWDMERAPEVLAAWADWTTSLPESVTTSVRLLRFPPLPELPPFLAGRSLVVVDGAVLEPDDRAAELLAPLRALAPELDTFGRIPVTAMLDVHMDPPGPTPAVSDHALLAELPPEAVDALLAVAGPGVQIPLMFAELRHLGGALARPQHAALSHLAGEYALFAVSPAPTPELVDLGHTITAGIVAALGPWTSGASFLNFADRAVDPASAFAPADWQRLQHVRDTYDPARVWVAAHAVGGR
ncbi:FAD-binding protein [Nocardia sp. NPDC057663]|uniref:FAD-binding protein n=1 Tax=Nocardia sp. NPDC057663 TaxID=3346201 RepID=UPI003670BE4A